jgi:ABC-type amino acid transport substrate-binding protein
MKTKTAIAITMALMAGVAQADTYDTVVQTGTIKLGFREKSVPVSFKDAQGNPAGQTVDECKAFVNYLEKKVGKTLNVEWVMVTPKDRIEAIKTGKIDLECGSTTNTEKRRVDVDFSIPTYISNMRVAKLPSTTFKLNDIQSVKIDAIVIGGTSAEDFVSIVNDKEKTTKPDYNKIIVKDLTEALDKLKASQKPAIVIYDDILLISAIKARADKNAFQVTDDHLSVDPYGIMYQKGSKLGKVLNDYLTVEMQTGAFTQTYNKWFTTDIIDNKGIQINLANRMSPLLADVIRFPSKVVGN